MEVYFQLWNYIILISRQRKPTHSFKKGKNNRKFATCHIDIVGGISFEFKDNQLVVRDVVKDDYNDKSFHVEIRIYETLLNTSFCNILSSYLDLNFGRSGNHGNTKRYRPQYTQYKEATVDQIKCYFIGRIMKFCSISIKGKLWHE